MSQLLSAQSTEATDTVETDSVVSAASVDGSPWVGLGPPASPRDGGTT